MPAKACSVCSFPKGHVAPGTPRRRPSTVQLSASKLELDELDSLMGDPCARAYLLSFARVNFCIDAVSCALTLREICLNVSNEASVGRAKACEPQLAIALRSLSRLLADARTRALAAQLCTSTCVRERTSSRAMCPIVSEARFQMHSKRPVRNSHRAPSRSSTRLTRLWRDT